MPIKNPWMSENLSSHVLDLEGPILEKSAANLTPVRQAWVAPCRKRCSASTRAGNRRVGPLRFCRARLSSEYGEGRQ